MERDDAAIVETDTFPARPLERRACHRLGYVAGARRQGKRDSSRACVKGRFPRNRSCSLNTRKARPAFASPAFLSDLNELPLAWSSTDQQLQDHPKQPNQLNGQQQRQLYVVGHSCDSQKCRRPLTSRGSWPIPSDDHILAWHGFTQPLPRVPVLVPVRVKNGYSQLTLRLASKHPVSMGSSPPASTGSGGISRDHPYADYGQPNRRTSKSSPQRTKSRIPTH